jgi:hypothetical protein
MIESINNNGGGGGGVQTVVAGTGISVDNTDPENPIVTNTVTDTDDKVRVSVNDTTAGYLNGKLVAGTGIGFTENNNGSNETLTVAIGNHDASLITTGTVATARLGTGTANSTTYLAGDQTYKAAVTSVNGSTGAVTVAAGDTTYTVTTADVENTSTRTRYVAFTIPANSWADGEKIELWLVRQMLQNSGSTYTWQDWYGGTTITENTQGFQNVSSNASTVNTLHVFELYRLGSSVYYSRVTASGGNFVPLYGTGLNVTNSYGNFYTEDSSVTFTSDITVYLEGKWSSANASAYQRILWAKAFKTTAGQQ